MRYLIYETNEIQTQKLWHSTDEEVLEPVAIKEFNPLMTTPHLVESVEKFLDWAIVFSNLEFSVALHLRTERDSDRSEDICHKIGRMHYHLIFYSNKFPKTIDKIIKKLQFGTQRNNGTSHWKKQFGPDNN